MLVGSLVTDAGQVSRYLDVGRVGLKTQSTTLLTSAQVVETKYKKGFFVELVLYSQLAWLILQSPVNGLVGYRALLR